MSGVPCATLNLAWVGCVAVLADNGGFDNVMFFTLTPLY